MQKHRILSQEGEFMGKRHHSSYEISLFAYDKTYYEVWRKIGLQMVYWIEEVKNTDQLSEYLTRN